MEVGGGGESIVGRRRQKIREHFTYREEGEEEQIIANDGEKQERLAQNVTLSARLSKGRRRIRLKDDWRKRIEISL